MSRGFIPSRDLPMTLRNSRRVIFRAEVVGSAEDLTYEKTRRYQQSEEAGRPTPSSYRCSLSSFVQQCCSKAVQQECPGGGV